MNHGLPDDGSGAGFVLETDRLHIPLRLPSRDAIDSKKGSEVSSSKIGASAKSGKLSRSIPSSSKRREVSKNKSKPDSELVALLERPKAKPRFREIEVSSKQSVSDISDSSPGSYREGPEKDAEAAEEKKAILQFSELLAREVDAVPVITTDSVALEGSKASELETLIASVGSAVSDIYESKSGSQISSKQSVSDPGSYPEGSQKEADLEERKAILQFSELLAREVEAVPPARTDSVALEDSKTSELETLFASVGSAVSDIYENKSVSQPFSLELQISSVCSAVTGIHDGDQSAAPPTGPEIRISSVGSAVSSICDPDESTGSLDLPFELEVKPSVPSNGLNQADCEEELVYTAKPQQNDCAQEEKPIPLKHEILGGKDRLEFAVRDDIQQPKSDEETMNIEQAIHEDKSTLRLLEDSEPTKLETTSEEPTVFSEVRQSFADSKLKKGDVMAEKESVNDATLSPSRPGPETIARDPERRKSGSTLSKSDDGTEPKVLIGKVSNKRFDDELSVDDLESILACEDSEGSICLDDDPEGPELATYAAVLSISLPSENGLVSGEPDQQGHGSATTSMSHTEACRTESFTKHLLSITAGDESESNDFPEQPQCDRRMSETLELADDKYGPNRPHPALEYPLLYFFLRRCPWLFDRIKTLYAFRWWSSYPLQRKVPYSRALRKLGIYLTWGELLLLLPFFAAIVAGILYTFAFPSVIVTGKIARFGLIGALVFAQRNSLVTLLLGIPFDRAVFYHKLSGRIGGIVGLLHTAAYFVDPAFRNKHRFDALGGAFTGQVNISGSVLMLLIIAITLSSLPPIRRRLFEVFYYLHVLFTTGMITCAFFHSGILVPILALLTWGADLFIRSIVMARTRYPRKAQLKIISETVVEISFPKTSAFAYNPGQYLYLAIPEISWLQWHPFSISSSPKQRVVTLHIRKAGNWTSALFDLTKTRREVSILLEGPYGNVGVDIMGDRKYKNIMLISGGIGLTPMQSICDQLLYEKAKNRRELHCLKFVWIERDPVLMEKHEFVKRTSSIGSVGSLDRDDYLSSVCFSDADASESIIECPANMETSQSNLNLEAQFLQQEHSIDIASQLLSLVPPGKTTDEELDKMFESAELVLEDDAQQLHGLPMNQSSTTQVLPLTRRPSFVVEEETSFADNGSPWLVEAPQVVESLMKVLDMQVYLTGNGPTMGIPYARNGRPDIKKIFLEMKKQAIATGDNRVAVCVSAPLPLTDLCHKACIVYSDDKFRFDFHSEVMAL